MRMACLAIATIHPSNPGKAGHEVIKLTSAWRFLGTWGASVRAPYKYKKHPTGLV